MRIITSGHFTAYVDAYDPDAPFIEIRMTCSTYTDKADGWRGELEDEMKRLEKGIADYLAYAKQLREEERAYAV